MIFNYLKIALRSFRKNLSHSLINVIGLTLAITCSLAISLLVRDELSYDTFHQKGDRIYRLITQQTSGIGGFTTGVPMPLPLAIKTDFPEIEIVMQLDHFGGGRVTIPQEGGQPKVFIEDEGMVYVEDGFFQIFDWAWLSGDQSTALSKPNAVVLSQSYAEKYFGSDDVLGRSLTLDESIDLVVTGVVKDRPFNTDFPFEVMISFSTTATRRDMTAWNSTSSDDQCFMMLPKGMLPELIENRFEDFAVKHIGEDASKKRYILQPLSDMHYSTEVANMNYRSISQPMILAIGLIAVFLLVIGCINFINLETARAIKRAKEVGIRKTLGSKRVELIIQFLGETGLIVLISMLISLGLTEILLIYLRDFSSLPLEFHPFGNLLLMTQLIALVIIITLGAGFYPAMVLSSYKASEVLKGVASGRSGSKFGLRQILVSFQFAVSQLFIVCTLITMQQVNYIRNADMGFDKESIVDLTLHDNSLLKQEFIQSELDKIPGISNYALCSRPPFSGSVSATNINLMSTPDFDDVITHFKMVDENYINTYKLELLAGEGLVKTDTANRYVINETLAILLDFDSPEKAVGEFLNMNGMELPVSGVVKDFHTTSFSEKIAPVLLTTGHQSNRTVGIKIEPSQIRPVLASLESIWQQAYPDYQFEPKFLDEAIMDYYDSEQKMTKLLSGFSIIAIIIGSLGLYGLISFMVNQKAKEVGIRKTLGASSASIVRLFSFEFLRLLIVGFIISAPLAWIIMDGWLQQYVYKIDIGMMVFIAGLAGSMLIAFTSIGYQSIKVATSNPVEALKDE